MGDQLANSVSSCLAGNMESCQQIRLAQHPVTGAWFRNPYMRNHPETAEFQPSFSRDQMMGSRASTLSRLDKTGTMFALEEWPSVY
jgi:hypothetical protein